MVALYIFATFSLVDENLKNLIRDHQK
jgi:hypothetical protein